MSHPIAISRVAAAPVAISAAPCHWLRRCCAQPAAQTAPRAAIPATNCSQSPAWMKPLAVPTLVGVKVAYAAMRKALPRTKKLAAAMASAIAVSDLVKYAMDPPIPALVSRGCWHGAETRHRLGCVEWEETPRATVGPVIDV